MLQLCHSALLESREKFEIKLTKPLKFLTGISTTFHNECNASLNVFLGRKDCISEDPEGRKYVTTKPEVSLLEPQSLDIIRLEISARDIIVNDQVQNIMFGDAKHLIDFGRTSFGMEALHWTAVQV